MTSADEETFQKAEHMFNAVDDAEGAYALLKDLLRNAWDEEQLLFWGYILFYTDRSEEALSLSNEILDKNPYNRDAHALKGLVLLYDFERPEDAIVSLSSALEFFPETPVDENERIDGLVVFEALVAAVQSTSQPRRAVKLIEEMTSRGYTLPF